MTRKLVLKFWLSLDGGMRPACALNTAVSLPGQRPPGLGDLYWLSMFADGLVNLYTRDIEAGLRFYRDLLGFTETFRTPTEGVPSHVELRLGGFTVGLGTVEAARRVHGVDPAPGSAAMSLVVWADDVDTAFRDLRAAGVPVLQEPHDTGNNNRNALLRDPDGNLVEIVSKVS